MNSWYNWLHKSFTVSFFRTADVLFPSIFLINSGNDFDHFSLSLKGSLEKSWISFLMCVPVIYYITSLLYRYNIYHGNTNEWPYLVIWYTVSTYYPTLQMFICPYLRKGLLLLFQQSREKKFSSSKYKIHKRRQTQTFTRITITVLHGSQLPRYLSLFM